MLKQIMNNTQLYVASMKKEDRKAFGQFFTDVNTARFMSKYIKCNKTEINILDPGCGNGLLSAALISNLVRKKTTAIINLTLYETDCKILPILKNTLMILEKKCLDHNIELNIELIRDNFILANENVWKNKKYTGKYDIVICNPPYLKIGKKSNEAIAMKDIVFGQPNLYNLFMAMSLHLLNEKGEMVFITPRSWTSGLYFRSFREYFLKHIDIKALHLFTARDKIFNAEDVLQEIMIMYGKKGNTQHNLITVSTCNDTFSYKNTNKKRVNSTLCIQKDSNRYLLIPVDNKDIEILQSLSSMQYTPKKLGFQFKTGQIVEFRNRENLKNNKEKGTIPIIHAANIVNGTVRFDVDTKKPSYFLLDNKHRNMCIKNCNTIIIKRFTSKEEQKRLQPGIYLCKHYPSDYITTENHVNYLKKIGNDFISICEIYGFYVILSSNIWDRYYRILDGSTQVNSEELNNMPLPSLEVLQGVGRRALQLMNEQNYFDADVILREAL